MGIVAGLWADSPVSIGSIPSSYIAEIKQQILWQRILHNTSLRAATSVFDRTLSPNFDLIIITVDSTFDRR
jgi:hypothetical protein